MARAALRLLLSFRIDITFARMSKSAMDFQAVQNPVEYIANDQNPLSITAYRRPVVCFKVWVLAHIDSDPSLRSLPNSFW